MPALIPAKTEEKPKLFPYEYSIQQRPAKLAYFRQVARHPLKNPYIPSTEYILQRFFKILPDHLSAPEISYLAYITPRGLDTIALAILAIAEAVKFEALLSGIAFSMVLSRQKQTALLRPVFNVLTTNPLQKDLQPSSVLRQEQAKQIFLMKLEDSVNLFGGTIRAILILSRGWRIAAVVVPAKYPQQPFLPAINKQLQFNYVLIYGKLLKLKSKLQLMINKKLKNQLQDRQIKKQPTEINIFES